MATQSVMPGVAGGNSWYLIDPATGNWLMTLTNVPSGTAVTDQDGSLLLYSYNANTGNLLCWNSSQSIPPSAPYGTGQQQWKLRIGATIDAVNDTSWTKMGILPTAVGLYDQNDILPRSGYTMNVTIDKNLPGINAVLQDDNRVPKEILFASSLGGLGSLGPGPSSDTFSAALVQINEHGTGYNPPTAKTCTQANNLGFTTTTLWSKNFTVPNSGHNYTYSLGGANYDSGIFVLDCKQSIQHYAYNLTTGTLQWGPTAPEGTFNYYGMSDASYYGKYMLSCGYSGTLYCYDVATGNLLWTYNATAPGHEGAYGSNMPLSIGAVSNGMVYLTSGEHSPTKPLWRQSLLRCVNITDGSEIWTLECFAIGGPAIADGNIVICNEYDNNVYCIGKGPTVTSLNAINSATVGNNVVIQGSVVDTSPGTKNRAPAQMYPHGVPAVADASQGQWMEYLYEQQAKPTNATGVPVSIDAIDANGNYQHIASVTTGTDGKFTYAWSPPNVPGQYSITASFAGSNSYWASSDVTSTYIQSAQATNAPAATPAQTVADMYFVPAIAGLFVLIIIVAIVLAMLMLRKRP